MSSYTVNIIAGCMETLLLDECAAVWWWADNRLTVVQRVTTFPEISMYMYTPNVNAAMLLNAHLQTALLHYVTYTPVDFFHPFTDWLGMS